MRRSDGERVKRLGEIAGAVSLLVVIAWVAYGEILHYEFTDVDTYSLINHGRWLSFADIGRILNSELMAGRMVNAIYYRPLTSLVFGAEYRIFGLHARGYHFVDLLLFTATAVAIFFTARALFSAREGRWIGFWGAVFFLLHPVQIDNPPAIARLGDLLAGFLAVTSILAFVHFYRSPQKSTCTWCLYVVSIWCAFLGLAAKEPAAVTPGVIALIAFFYSSQSPGSRRLRETFWLVLPFALMTAFFVFWRWKTLGGLGGYVSVRGKFADPQVLQLAFRFQTTLLGHILVLFLPLFSDDFDRYADFFMHRNWLLLLLSAGMLIALVPKAARKIHQMIEEPCDAADPRDLQPRALAVIIGFFLLHGFLLFFLIFTPRYLYLSTIPFALLLGFAVTRRFSRKPHTWRDGLSLGVLIVILVVMFGDSPFWYKAKLRRWRDGAYFSRQTAERVYRESSVQPDSRLFLLNVPYVRIFGKSAPFFWELPFNQLLLEHALADYCDLRRASDGQPTSEVVALNYLYLTTPPDQVEVDVRRIGNDTFSLVARHGAILTPFPWSRIPGRDAHFHLFDSVGGKVPFAPEPAEGWSGRMTLRLNPEVFEGAPPRFLNLSN